MNDTYIVTIQVPDRQRKIRLQPLKHFSLSGALYKTRQMLSDFFIYTCEIQNLNPGTSTIAKPNLT